MGKNWHPSFLFQMILGSLIIITYEYLTGVIVNIYLNLHVWDYSKVPFNYPGTDLYSFSYYMVLCNTAVYLDRRHHKERSFLNPEFAQTKKEMNPANLIFPDVTLEQVKECG